MFTGVLCKNCGNLVQNFSFESGLSFWKVDNVTTTDNSSSEGTQVAILGPSVASLYQDVPLQLWCRKPLFLSFIAYTQGVGPGDLVAEVLWLNANGEVIGIGLRAFISSPNISNVRITFFDVTERPPVDAVAARLLFSKDAGGLPLLLDLANLAPVETPNLVRNPSFELGLAEWNSTGFSTNGVAWEGGMAVRQTSAVLGTLTQEIPLNPFLPGAAYLLCFAASSPLPASVTAQLIWLNALGNPIGSPGIDATIAPNTLAVQDKYLSFMQLSGPEPIGAVRARLIFTALGAADSQLDLDKVILVRFAAPNLIQNPGFASGLTGWTSVNVTPQNTGGFVGQNFVEFFQDAALINQTVVLPFGSACRCFLLNFALHYSGAGGDGNVLAQVRWLDARGNDIGLGLSIIVSQPVQPATQWQVYTGFTERAPLGAVSARIQFTKSAGNVNTEIGLDSVIFARVD